MIRIHQGVAAHRAIVIIVVAVVALLSIQYSCSASVVSASEDECNNENYSGTGSKQCLQQPNTRRMSPSDLQLPNVFDDFGANRSVALSDDATITAMPGSILQQGRHKQYQQDSSSTKNNSMSELVVLPGFVPRSVVAEMLTLLRGHEDADTAGGKTTIVLDDDPDSVDGMTSQEIFVDNDSLRAGQLSKGDPNENMQERKVLRDKLKALTDRYSHELLMPFLQEWYGTQKCGRPGRTCTPCYSLIRRYRAGERQSHAPHHDAHSFVTVVISLTDYGREYNGGLYVSTKNSEKNFVKLNRGDAVVHQGYLHHGVKVLDKRHDGGPSERWSWIMWFRDSDTCQDHAREWHRECAEDGNPTCMYLRAATEGNAHDIVHWNQKASDAGHAQASVKLAYAYLKKLPSHLEYDRNRATHLFREAILSSNEPDGHYGIASLLLEDTKKKILEQPTNEAKAKAAKEAWASPEVMQAIVHLEEAAKGGHVFAMFNLGICYTYGYNRKDGERNFELATDWFEASGLPEGFFVKSEYLKAVGRTQEAEKYKKKGSILGFGSQWRQEARERTGSGGSSGAKLNLQWPPLPSGEFPPEW